MPDFNPNNMQGIDLSNIPGMEGMQGMAVAMFAAYRVPDYAAEIKTLKEWMHERLAVMDEAFLIR